MYDSFSLTAACGVEQGMVSSRVQKILTLNRNRVEQNAMVG